MNSTTFSYVKLRGSPQLHMARVVYLRQPEGFGERLADGELVLRCDFDGQPDYQGLEDGQDYEDDAGLK